MEFLSTRSRVRRLLEKTFPTASEFDAFCLDHFPDVHTMFTSDLNRVERTNLLLVKESPQAIIKHIGDQAGEGLHHRFPHQLLIAVTVAALFLVVGIAWYAVSYRAPLPVRSGSDSAQTPPPRLAQPLTSPPTPAAVVSPASAVQEGKTPEVPVKTPVHSPPIKAGVVVQDHGSAKVDTINVN